MDMALSEIGAALLPRTYPVTVLLVDIMLYIMFFLNLIAFFMQDDKQIMATMLMGLVMLANIVGKLSTYYVGLRNPIEYFDVNHLVMLLVNSVIFVVPIIVSGMSKSKKSKPLTILSGVLGGAYFGMFWFFFQLNG